MLNDVSNADAALLAKTDLYDAQKKRIVNIYSGKLLATLGLTGVIAVTLTAFLGYPTDHGFAALPLFHKPVALFAWLCALIYVLQWAILRHPLLRQLRNATWVVTTISILIVAAIDLHWLDFLRQLPHGFLNSLIQLVGQGIPYAVVNYGILGLVLVDSIRRWILCWQKKPITLNIDIGGSRREVTATKSEAIPALGDLISGDLIVFGALALIFSEIFAPTSLNLLHRVGVATQQSCSQTLFALGPCLAQGQHLFDVPSLSLEDLVAGLVALLIGLVWLGLSAVVIAIQHGGSTQEVVREVFRALSEGLNKRINLGLQNMGATLRHPIWCVLVFGGVGGAALAAHYSQSYLQAVSDNSDCHKVQSFFSSQCLTSGTLASGTNSLIIVVLSMVTAAVCIALAAALLLTKTHVASNSLRFIWQVIKDVAVGFWLLSLGFSVLNLLIYVISHAFVMNPQVRGPFPQPSPLTLLSLALFAVIAIRLPRNPGEAEPQVPAVARLIGPLTGGRRKPPVPTPPPTSTTANSA